MTKNPLIIDSTKTRSWMQCKRKYYYSYLSHLESAKATALDLVFGSVVHECLEFFENQMLAGLDKEEALISALQKMQSLTDPWTADQVFLNESKKNRTTAIRLLIWYAEQFHENGLDCSIKPVANEIPFRESLRALVLASPFADQIDLTGIDDDMLVCGRLDSIVEGPSQGEFWIRERKAQPLTSKVLTESGWTTIGQLQVGDRIAGSDGKFHNVIGLYPKGVTSAYEVIFEDGTKTQCALEHLWEVSDSGIDSWKTREFKYILPRIQAGRKYHVPVSEAVEFPQADLPLDPYLVAALLGDGYLGGHSVSFSTGNLDLAQKITERAPEGDIVRKSPSNNLIWTITGKGNCKTLAALRELGLWGKLSKDKFIPEKYLFASVTQRWDLLRGFIDTDTSWNRKSLRYGTMSPKLCEGFCYLVRSLGGSASVCVRADGVHVITYGLTGLTKDGQEARGIRRKYIKGVSQIADTETMCIEVDAENHLYLTDDFIVTHNTTNQALTQYYWARYEPDIQISLYSWVAKLLFPDLNLQGVLLEAFQVGTGFVRMQRREFKRWPEQAIDTVRSIVSAAREMDRAGIREEVLPPVDTFLLNEGCCMAGGMPCNFRAICNEAPRLRKYFIADNFRPKKPWNPLDDMDPSMIASLSNRPKLHIHS